jgi:hypothetical protein
MRLTVTQYKHYILIVVAIIIGLCLVGFAGKVIWHEATKERPHFNTGSIVNKNFDPAHYDDYTTQQYVGETCNGTGASQVCTSNYVTVWHHDYVPDNWSIQIENCNVYHKNGDLWVDKHGNAKCFKKWLDVDHGAYDQYRIGNRYA